VTERERLETRLLKIQELKMRLEVSHSDPRGCRGEPCIAASSYEWTPAPDGIGSIPRFIGESNMRIAGRNNPRFKPGQKHQQCQDCRRKEKNLREIQGLKLELGY